MTNGSFRYGYCKSDSNDGEVEIFRGKISKQWDYADIVRQAQLSFVSKDKNASLLTKTDDLSYSDTAHYDTQGFIDLGNYFAEAIWHLMDRQEAY